MRPSRKRSSTVTTPSSQLSPASLPSCWSRCIVCGLSGRGHLPLASCWSSDCQATYHMTCAQLAGVFIASDVYPDLFYLACERHPVKHRQRDLSNLESVAPGDEVIVRRPVNPPKFVPGIALRLVSPLYCRILFPDGTFSNDTPPEYLTNIDYFNDGLPARGASVKVLWDDGVEYSGTFQGTNEEQWEVQLESKRIITLSRLQFFIRPGSKSVRKREAGGLEAPQCCRRDYRQLFDDSSTFEAIKQM